MQVSTKHLSFTLGVAILAGALTKQFAAAQSASPKADTLNFISKEIRLDESMGKKLAQPTFPGDWKLVSVSNGEKANSNALWFQDAKGDVHLVSGFHTRGTFVVDLIAQTLKSGQ